MGGIYHKGDPYSRQMVVDSVLSANSNNPVKNSVLAGIIGSLSSLSTADKSNLVAAINEIVGDESILKITQYIDTSGNMNITDAPVGITYYYYASNNLNSPYTSTNGYLIHLRRTSANTACLQIAIIADGSRIYTRNYDGSSWTTWKQIYPEIGDLINGTLATSDVSIAKNGGSGNLGSITFPVKGVYIITVNGWSNFGGTSGNIYLALGGVVCTTVEHGSKQFSMSGIMNVNTDNYTSNLSATNWTDADYNSHFTNVYFRAILLKRT